MSAPRYTAGTLVEVIKAHPLYASIIGRRFVLAGDAQRHEDLWCWEMPDDWRKEYCPPECIHFLAPEEMLKPILDDGRVAGHWSDCTWRPHRVPEEA